MTIETDIRQAVVAAAGTVSGLNVVDSETVVDSADTQTCCVYALTGGVVEELLDTTGRQLRRLDVVCEVHWHRDTGALLATGLDTLKGAIEDACYADAALEALVHDFRYDSHEVQLGTHESGRPIATMQVNFIAEFSRDG